MSEIDAVAGLLARIDRSQQVLARLVAEYRTFSDGDFKLLGRKNTSAIVIAEMMVDYCTCAETLFLRVSQFFENHLEERLCPCGSYVRQQLAGGAQALGAAEFRGRAGGMLTCWSA